MQYSFVNVSLQECVAPFFEFDACIIGYACIDHTGSLRWGRIRWLCVSDQLHLHVIGKLRPEIHLLLYFSEACCPHRDCVQIRDQIREHELSAAVGGHLTYDAAAETLKSH